MPVPVEANSYSTGHTLSLVFHQCPLIITRMQSFPLCAVSRHYSDRACPQIFAFMLQRVQWYIG